MSTTNPEFLINQFFSQFYFDYFFNGVEVFQLTCRQKNEDITVHFQSFKDGERKNREKNW